MYFVIYNIYLGQKLEMARNLKCTATHDQHPTVINLWGRKIFIANIRNMGENIYYKHSRAKLVMMLQSSNTFTKKISNNIIFLLYKIA